MNKLTLLKCNGSANISVLLIRCIKASLGESDYGQSKFFCSSLYPGWLRCITRVHFIVNPIANLGYLDKLHIRREVQAREDAMKTTRGVCVKWQMVRDGFRSCL